MKNKKTSVKSAKSGKTVKATVATKNSEKVGMRYTKLTAAEKLEVISSRKKRGDNVAVAKELGINPVYVSLALTGKKVNEKVNEKVINRMYNKVRGRKAKVTAA